MRKIVLIIAIMFLVGGIGGVTHACKDGDHKNCPMHKMEKKDGKKHKCPHHDMKNKDKKEKKDG